MTDNRNTEKTSSRNNLLEEFLLELQSDLSDPIQKKLIGAYRGDDPVSSMEAELARILLEVIEYAN